MTVPPASGRLVVFLADGARARVLAERLADSPFDASVADTSDALYRFVNSERVDYLILQNELDSYFSGLDLLEKINDDLLCPVAILIAAPNPTTVDRARRLGVEVVLDQGAGPDQILETLDEVVSQRTGRQVFIGPEARKAVLAVQDIPPLPQLVVKLAGCLVDEADLSLEGLANDISVDAKITAEVLTLINSASIGMNRKITRIFEAIKFLGIRPTISLILSTTVINAQKHLGKRLEGFDRQWYNKRSVLVASTAYTFAKDVGQVSPDTAYVLGLFQELGILVLASAFGEKYAQCVRRVREVGALRLESLEEAELGVSHAEVGAAILQKWGLPLSLVTPVLDHHQEHAKLDAKPDVERRFLHVMQIGEAAANLADVTAPQRFQQLKRLIDDYGVRRIAECKQALREAVYKAAESSRIFNIAIPDEETLNALVARMLTQLGKL